VFGTDFLHTDGRVICGGLPNTHLWMGRKTDETYLDLSRRTAGFMHATGNERNGDEILRSLYSGAERASDCPARGAGFGDEVAFMTRICSGSAIYPLPRGSVSLTPTFPYCRNVLNLFGVNGAQGRNRTTDTRIFRLVRRLCIRSVISSFPLTIQGVGSKFVLAISRVLPSNSNSRCYLFAT
jgi:hypothetical protein